MLDFFSNSNGQANRSNLGDFEPGIFRKLVDRYIGMSMFFHPHKLGKTRSKIENNDISKEHQDRPPSLQKVLGT